VALHVACPESLRGQRSVTFTLAVRLPVGHADKQDRALCFPDTAPAVCVPDPAAPGVERASYEGGRVVVRLDSARISRWTTN